jgi:hypothetical protein
VWRVTAVGYVCGCGASGQNLPGQGANGCGYAGPDRNWGAGTGSGEGLNISEGHRRRAGMVVLLSTVEQGGTGFVNWCGVCGPEGRFGEDITPGLCPRVGVRWARDGVLKR